MKLRALTEGAIMVAIAQLLGYIKLGALPNGGSITLNMLPIFIFCVRWGMPYGIMASFVLSLLQLFLDGAYAWGWQSIVGDYILAYSAIGIAALFKGKKNGLYIGSIVATFVRFIISYVVGAVVWGEYMPSEFFGMTMTTPWFYSALYNGSYLLACLILCLIAEALLMKPMRKYIN